jgi:hypothetical protein
MKMRASLAVLLAMLVCVAVLAPGCTWQRGQINVSAIQDSVVDITARHDLYVKDDPALDDLTKGVLLRESELLRRVVDEAADVPAPVE